MDNLILVDKKIGITSNDVAQRVKRITASKSAGHSGTLDPLASGLLIIAINENTKLLNQLIELDKTYVVDLKFGEHTDTYDKEGIVTKTSDYFPSLIETKNAITHFNHSQYIQEVPIYSSVKVNGKRLYEYARAKQFVKLPSKVVTINELKLINFDHKEKIIKLEISVSKGFYVRSFAVDFSKFLKSFAHVSALRRTRIGQYFVADAISDDEDLWKYHSKVKIITKETNLNEHVKNLLIGQFDVLHIGQSKMFFQEDFSILTFVGNPSKKEYCYSILQRINRLNEFNPKNIYVFSIGINNKKMKAHEFNDLILKQLNPEQIKIGSNFKYGTDKKDKDFISKSFNTEIIPLKENCNSSIIRNYLLNGELEKSNELSLKDFYISGSVVRGLQKGRVLGFPTANIFWKTNVGLKPGSYSSIAIIGRNEYQATTFIWNCHDECILTETHIHDFDKDIYNKIIKVILFKFIKQLSKVHNDKELIDKITLEVEESKKNHNLRNK